MFNKKYVSLFIVAFLSITIPAFCSKPSCIKSKKKESSRASRVSFDANAMQKTAHIDKLPDIVISDNAQMPAAPKKPSLREKRLALQKKTKKPKFPNLEVFHHAKTEDSQDEDSDVKAAAEAVPLVDATQYSEKYGALQKAMDNYKQAEVAAICTKDAILRTKNVKDLQPHIPNIAGLYERVLKILASDNGTLDQIASEVHNAQTTVIEQAAKDLVAAYDAFAKLDKTKADQFIANNTVDFFDGSWIERLRKSLSAVN